ncbi:MAG: SAM-dependent methyltransferase [Lachnospiraceae bacterium]|nr:SAM-dependent methyltransferase [Lachnospiraceae bacterium]
MKLLPERLAAAASFVEKNSVIADVGCDHGLLPHYLLKEGIAEFAYLIDKNRGPLLRAGENTEKYGLGGKCALVLSDGLTGLPDHIEKEKVEAGFPDTVIITGMGGPLIKKIIDETPLMIKENVRNWILSPQSLIDEFREEFNETGLRIVEEKEVREKRKSYVIFKAGRKDGIS